MGSAFTKTYCVADRLIESAHGFELAVRTGRWTDASCQIQAMFEQLNGFLDQFADIQPDQAEMLIQDLKGRNSCGLRLSDAMASLKPECAARQPAASAIDSQRQPAVARAAQWLEDILATGSMEADAVRMLADADGISHRTLDRAKKAMGVKSVRQGFCNASWFWVLPVEDRQAVT